jgi:hypothetical protein
LLNLLLDLIFGTIGNEIAFTNSQQTGYCYLEKHWLFSDDMIFCYYSNFVSSSSILIGFSIHRVTSSPNRDNFIPHFLIALE